jgi:tungstate transport system ATP-binding protein
VTGPLIALRSASVRFGERQALGDVDFEIARGERIAVVGANGSGKSSLLRAVHGLVPLARGQRELARPAPRIAMLFQRPFMLRMSAQANVEIGLRLQGMPASARRQRALQALHQVGLAGEAGRNARVLSAGQQQRVALARAWALRPDVLLLDEPTASLDPTAKREIETLVEQFAAEGTTLLMSSHNLGQVKRLAGRVLYLEHGRLLADVPTDGFFNGPLPEAAALFLKGELPWA